MVVRVVALEAQAVVLVAVAVVVASVVVHHKVVAVADPVDLVEEGRPPVPKGGT